MFAIFVTEFSLNLIYLVRFFVNHKEKSRKAKKLVKCAFFFLLMYTDEPGIQLFAFHGNVNTPLTHDLEAGTMSRDIVRPRNGRWIYQNDNLRLRNGDVVYYWLYVIVDGIGHQKLNQKWVVRGTDNSVGIS